MSEQQGAFAATEVPPAPPYLPPAALPAKGTLSKASGLTAAEGEKGRWPTPPCPSFQTTQTDPLFQHASINCQLTVSCWGGTGAICAEGAGGIVARFSSTVVRILSSESRVLAFFMLDTAIGL